MRGMKTIQIRQYLAELPGEKPERISREHARWIAGKFQVSEGYVHLLIRGAGIRVSDSDVRRGPPMGAKR